MQDALSKSDQNRVRITAQVWEIVDDFRAIADSLRSRPTRLPELVPARRLIFSAPPTHAGSAWAAYGFISRMPRPKFSGATLLHPPSSRRSCPPATRAAPFRFQTSN